MRVPERRKDKARRRVHDALPILVLIDSGVTKVDAIYFALERAGTPKPKWYIAHVIRVVTAALTFR